MTETLQSVENKEEEIVGFDLRTHVYDKKTGAVIKYQPYTRYVDRDKGTWYVRDGLGYYETGERCPEHDVVVAKAAEPKDKVNHKEKA